LKYPVAFLYTDGETMEIPTSPYLPPQGFAALPLQRFVPPFPEGVIEAWLSEKIPTGSWLIDPLGANPLLSLRAAQAGYRILTARTNPILRLELEVLAATPRDDQFTSVLNSLLNASMADSSVDEYLRSLYLTHCPKCQSLIQAHGYVWERGSDLPAKVIYACPNCGEKGEEAPTRFDLDLLDHINQQKAKFVARARQRVATGQEAEYVGLEEALKCYPNRALHFLMVLINKLDGLSLSSESKHHLMALLVTLMDLGNNLWHWPPKPFRPLTLTTPPIFLERNLWVVLSQIVHFWTREKQPVVVTHFPDLPPPGGGICLYQRRKTSLETISAHINPQAMLTIIPRPNQAFLTFSALWSGWLWGSTAVEHVHGALERRRYDWHWLAGMLQQILRPVQQALPAGSPALAFISEPTPANLFAITASAKSCQFDLQGLAYRSQDDLFQLQWRTVAERPTDHPGSEENAIRTSIESLIQMRGEPVVYEDLLYASLIDNALHGQLPEDMPALRDDYLNPHLGQVKTILQNAFLTRSYKHPTLPQSSLYWLAQDKDASPPLADRVEELVVEHLQRGQDTTLYDLDHQVCQTLTSWNTPSREMIHACLESYADPTQAAPLIYHLRHEDEKENRENDRRQVQQILTSLAKRLGYQLKDNHAYLWQSREGWEYKFFFLPTACLSSILSREHELPPQRCILIIPGSRSHLVHFKLQRDPHLQEQLDLGWRFIKLRFLRELATRDTITPFGWEESLKEDPPSWDTPTQLQML